jgi:hypothetical protein
MTMGPWALVLIALVACSGTASSSRYPPRPDGCAVQILEQSPTVPTDNIGRAHSVCAPEISKDDCLRELKDQACRLGGDVVWGVPSAPSQVDGRNRWDGRVAHTR